jgi:hypothetical protein
MKNIICIKGLSNCSYCHMDGFFCETPSGSDYHTCPCCGKPDFKYLVTSEARFTKRLNLTNTEQLTKYDFLKKEEYDDDMRNTFDFCDSCNIIFELGCTHSSRGCTDDIYNCHFISKWKNKVTNEEHNGMPQFENSDDWFDNVNSVEVLEMYCPHNGNRCKKTHYEITSLPCNINITKK